MNPTNTTQKKKNRAGFGRQGAVFQNDITATAMRRKSVSEFAAVLCGRDKQALEMLAASGAGGLTQGEALRRDPSAWRLAASVCSLRDKGVLIASLPVPTGRGGTATRYVLRGFNAEGAHHG